MGAEAFKARPARQKRYRRHLTPPFYIYLFLSSDAIKLQGRFRTFGDATPLLFGNDTGRHTEDSLRIREDDSPFGIESALPPVPEQGDKVTTPFVAVEFSPRKIDFVFYELRVIGAETDMNTRVCAYKPVVCVLVDDFPKAGRIESLLSESKA